MKDLARLLRYVRPYVRRLAAAVVCSGLVSLAYLGLFSLIQPIFDQVFARNVVGPAATGGKIQLLDETRRLIGAGGRTFAPLASLASRIGEGSAGTGLLVALLLVVLFLFKGLFTYLSEYFTRWTGLQAVLDLRRDLYARIHRQSPAFFSEHPTGLLIARVMNDVGRIQRTVSGDLAEIFRLVAIVLGQAVWLFYLNARLAAFCLVLLPLILHPVARFGSRLKVTSRRSQERLGDAVSIMKEGLAATRVVQAFGMEEFEIERFSAALSRMQRAEKRAARLLSLSGPVLELMGAVGGAILIWYAVLRINSGKLSPGEFATFVAALFMIYTSIKNLVKIYNEVQQSMASARRVFEIMDLENRIREKPDAIELPAFRERIEFCGVHFAYGQAPVLRGIDLTVPAGQVVALVGPSGAGKSTLVNLLSRFYDVTQGAVLIDGLFDDTVRNNIAYGRTDIPLERVVEAARAAYADTFIRALPHGYDTRLGEAAHRLSLGQRQRLSIARAILKDSPVLILDEATSSLDMESEAEVQGALQNLIAGRTVFVIAHRISTVRRADTILVLEGGMIVERGPHPDLLERKGLYARLHALQFRDTEPAPEASAL